MNVVAETPELPHGETTENPIPAPKDKSTSVSARGCRRSRQDGGPLHPGHRRFNKVFPACSVEVLVPSEFLPSSRISCLENAHMERWFLVRNSPFRAPRGVRTGRLRPRRAPRTRLNFVPFPTPLFDAQGRFIGAVNMLIDVTASKRAGVLREQARRCRRLAVSVDDDSDSFCPQWLGCRL